MRSMNVNIPIGIVTEVAEIIERDEIENEILGAVEDEEELIVEFNYTDEQRGTLMEILEIIEDYKGGNEEENEEEE